jgi:hypothetical protein
MREKKIGARIQIIMIYIFKMSARSDRRRASRHHQYCQEKGWTFLVHNDQSGFPGSSESEEIIQNRSYRLREMTHETVSMASVTYLASHTRSIDIAMDIETDMAHFTRVRELVESGGVRD